VREFEFKKKKKRKERKKERKRQKGMKKKCEHDPENEVRKLLNKSGRLHEMKNIRGRIKNCNFAENLAW
jgi:hypothetical protein